MNKLYVVFGLNKEETRSITIFDDKTAAIAFAQSFADKWFRHPEASETISFKNSIFCLMAEHIGFVDVREVILNEPKETEFP